MNEPTVMPSAPRVRRFTALWVLAPVIFGLVLAGGVSLYRSQFTGAGPLLRITGVSNPAIEERWGIRVTQIGVTADGGLIDFRYMVIDPAKAFALTENEDNLPVLINEDNGRMVQSAALMAHRHELESGVTYFLLYRNTRGAIQPGANVSVVMGDLRLEHLRAQ